MPQPTEQQKAAHQIEQMKTPQRTEQQKASQQISTQESKIR